MVFSLATWSSLTGAHSFSMTPMMQLEQQQMSKASFSSFCLIKSTSSTSQIWALNRTCCGRSSIIIFQEKKIYKLIVTLIMSYIQFHKILLYKNTLIHIIMYLCNNVMQNIHYFSNEGNKEFLLLLSWYKKNLIYRVNGNF